jgi:hypothetical protein
VYIKVDFVILLHAAGGWQCVSAAERNRQGIGTDSRAWRIHRTTFLTGDSTGTTSTGEGSDGSEAAAAAAADDAAADDSSRCRQAAVGFAGCVRVQGTG